MLTVHHLNDSRSQRILWLLEELELPYDIKRYQRDATTRLAPPELKAVHPLGKSPVITDGDVTIAESGAIVDYVLRTHGNGRLQPEPGREHEAYNEWLHYAKGSAMLPLMLNLYVSRLGEAGAPLHPRIESELADHLGYVEGALKGRDYLMGPQLTGADIQMSFVGEMARAFAKLKPYPAISAWVDRFRPARPTSAASRRAGRTVLRRRFEALPRAQCSAQRCVADPGPYRWQHLLRSRFCRAASSGCAGPTPHRDRDKKFLSIHHILHNRPTRPASAR